MRPAYAMTMATLAAVAGCSSASVDSVEDRESDGPMNGRVSINDEYENHARIVKCTTLVDGTTRIELLMTPSTSLVLSENSTQVDMVNVGGGGSSGPHLVYLGGSPKSGMKAQVTRDGDTFTVTGVGIVTMDDPERPLLKPFEVMASCR